MVRIAVCDDDVTELARLVTLLDEYRLSRKLDLVCHPFKDGLSMVASMQSQPYHIAILDVLMPGFTGIEAAHEIRSFDESVKLVFLSASPEFAVESYAVDAYYYLLKPANQTILFSLLDRAVASVEHSSREGLVLKRRSGILRIPYGELEMVEVVQKTVSFYMRDGSKKEIYGALSEVESDLLARPEFVKTHRSYIVNMKHISQLGGKTLNTHGGQVVPISKSMYGEVREAYMKYLFAEKEVD